jgi:hypothetical protein
MSSSEASNTSSSGDSDTDYTPVPEDFKARLHELPRNLFHTIQHLTFLAYIEESVYIEEPSERSSRRDHVKQLKIIQLSPATRKRYAEKFYGTLQVLFSGEECSYPVNEACRWLRSVAPKHRKFIGYLKIEPEGPGTGSHSAGQAMLRNAAIKEKLKKKFGAKVADMVELPGGNDYSRDNDSDDYDWVGDYGEDLI